MTPTEWIGLGYQHFGPEAMKVWDQFVIGEIDWDNNIILLGQQICDMNK